MDITVTSTQYMPHMPLDLNIATDDALMREVSYGNADALAEIYERHVRGCFGLAMKIVRDPWIAEEVVQDVFMKLWTRPHLFTPERGKFSGWLLTLVHNRSVDKLRRRKSAGANITVTLDADSDADNSLAEVLPDLAPGPYEQAVSSETGNMVRRDLDKLPEPQRQMLVMAYFEGLTQREIAEKLRQPIGTVKTRTRTALMQMRKLLIGQDLRGEVE